MTLVSAAAVVATDNRPLLHSYTAAALDRDWSGDADSTAGIPSVGSDDRNTNHGTVSKQRRMTLSFSVCFVDGAEVS